MGWGENDRGVSFTFGAEVAAKFLHKHDFDLICRAHQVNEEAIVTTGGSMYLMINPNMYKSVNPLEWIRPQNWIVLS